MYRKKVKRQIEREKIVQILSTLCGALTRSPGSVLRSRAVSETSLTLNSLSHNETHRKTTWRNIDVIFFLRIESARFPRRIRCWVHTTVRSNRMRFHRGNLLRPTSRQSTRRESDHESNDSHLDFVLGGRTRGQRSAKVSFDGQH